MLLIGIYKTLDNIVFTRQKTINQPLVDCRVAIVCFEQKYSRIGCVQLLR